MAADYSIFNEPVFHLPITGRRNHRQGVIIGHALVPDDAFTLDEIAWRSWSLASGYPHSKKLMSDGVKGVFKLHAIVFEHYHGKRPQGMVIDHIDRNPLNNLPSNLRAVSRIINGINSEKKRNNTSGFKGVCFDKRSRKWRADIKISRKQVTLGYYTIIEDAAQAVNQAYQLHYPEVHVPNLIP